MRPREWNAWGGGQRVVSCDEEAQAQITLVRVSDGDEMRVSVCLVEFSGAEARVRLDGYAVARLIDALRSMGERLP